MRLHSAMSLRSLFAVGFVIAASVAAQGVDQDPNPPSKVSPKPVDAPFEDKDDGPPLNAPQTLLERRRARVKELEAEWKRTREEVEAHLADVSLTPEEEAKAAEENYENARLSREVAEIAVVEYTQGIAIQERGILTSEVAIADADLNRAQDRYDWSEEMFKAGKLSKHQLISDKLSLDRAIFSKEQAETSLNVFEKFTKNRETHKRTEDVEHLKGIEAEAKVRKGETAALAKGSHERSALLKSKVSEIHVAALLQEASALQEKAVNLLGVIPAAQKAEASDIAEAKRLAEEVQAKIDDAAKLEDQARVKVTQALALAERVQLWRDQLVDLDAELRKAREDLKRLEDTLPAR